MLAPCSFSSHSFRSVSIDRLNEVRSLAQENKRDFFIGDSIRGGIFLYNARISESNLLFFIETKGTGSFGGNY